MGSDLPRTEVSGRELDLIEKLLLLDAVLNKDGENLHKRLSTIPNGWRDYRMLARVADKLTVALLSTCPVRMLERLKYMGARSEIDIKTRPIGKGDPCMVVHTDAMRELINLVCTAECGMCAKFSAPEIKGCKLRKTLMDIAPLNDPPPPGRCGYRDILFDD